MRALRLAALAMLIGAGAARAGDAPGCAKFKWSVAREQSAFASPALPTVASSQSLPGVAQPVTLKLEPQSAVSFEKPPARKPKADPAFGALVSIAAVPASGTYQVTLSAEGWIDVLQAGKEVRSTGFSGQPDCPGVRKSVKFPLQAGPATLQISGVGADTIKVEVLPVE